MNIFIDEAGQIVQVFSSLARIITPEDLYTRADHCRKEAEAHPGNPYLRRNLETYERAIQAWEQRKESAA